jgi:hypothetical protein
MARAVSFRDKRRHKTYVRRAKGERKRNADYELKDTIAFIFQFIIQRSELIVYLVVADNFVERRGVGA